MAAVLAQWWARNLGRTEVFSSCRRVKARSESAQARWVKVPIRSKLGCWATKETSFWNSGRRAPSRFIPVSSLTWTRAVLRNSWAIRASSRASVIEERVIVRRCCRATENSEGRVDPSKRMGFRIPAPLNSSPSVAQATPNSSHPAWASVRLTGINPWP